MTKTNKEKDYRLEDGIVITAVSASQYVIRLRESSMFDSQLADDEYVRGFAHRQNLMMGAIVRTDTAEYFVDDLIKIGVVTCDT